MVNADTIDASNNQVITMIPVFLNQMSHQGNAAKLRKALLQFAVAAIATGRSIMVNHLLKTREELELETNSNYSCENLLIQED